jgi:PAS domain S-box-containing protein
MQDMNMAFSRRGQQYASQPEAVRLVHAEAALVASEERLLRSQRLGGAHPYEWDLVTGEFITHDTFAELYGLSPGQPVTYEAVTARIHPDDRPRVKATHQTAITSGGSYEQEYRVLLPNGGVRWILARGEAIHDSKGKPTALAGVAVDITRRKEAELALKQRETELAESERRFRVLANAMPQMVWSTRPDGYHDYYNQRWYEFTGMPEGSTDGEDWNGMFHPEDQERAWARWRHSLSTGEPYEIEYRLRHRSGEYRWVLGRALPVRNDQGEIERWFGTCTDIHDLKRVEEALANSEEFTRRLLASSDDCIKVLDLEGQLRFMSEGGKRVMEVDDFGKIEGCRWVDFWNGPAGEEARRAVETAKSGGTGRFEGFCPTVAGTPKWWDVAVTAVVGRDGRPERLLSISRDITERKRHEEQQALVTRELHHRVKNSLATVSAVVSSTARHAQTVNEYRLAVTERINALARTHTLLIENSYDGALLRDILLAELKPYDTDDETRVRLQGPEVRLPSEIAVAFGMAVHELTTNAAKYGAFSLPSGCVCVTWSSERVGPEQRLKVEWEERDGPPVVAPERQGFGSVLLQRALGRQLGGKVETTYAPEGLHVRISASFSALR